jgi:hypothetical protein
MECAVRCAAERCSVAQYGSLSAAASPGRLWGDFFIAFSNVALGLTIYSSRNGYRDYTREEGGLFFVTGVIYAIVGIFVWRGSLIALGLALAGYIFDSIGVFFTDTRSLLTIGLTGFFLRPIFLWLMIRAINPLRERRAQKIVERKLRPPMTKLQMSVLLAVILVVGVGGILLFVNNPTPRSIFIDAGEPKANSKPPIAQSPTVKLPTAQPSAVPPEEVVQLFPFKFSMGEYNGRLDRVIAISTEPAQIHRYNPNNGEEDIPLDLVLEASSLALSPDGLFAAIGHQNKITYVDLANWQIIKVLSIGIQAELLVLPDTGWIYAFDSNFDYDANATAQFVNITSGVTVTSEEIVEGELSHIPTRFILSHDSSSLYVLQELSVSRYDLRATGYPTALSAQIAIPIESIVHISWGVMPTNGHYLFLGCDVVLELSPSPQNDLKIVQNIKDCASHFKPLIDDWMITEFSIGLAPVWRYENGTRADLQMQTSPNPPQRIGDLGI